MANKRVGGAFVDFGIAAQREGGGGVGPRELSGLRWGNACENAMLLTNMANPEVYSA